MNLLADENVDGEIVAFLRESGHDVLWMVEHSRGTSDLEILKLAESDRRVILTFDRDSANLSFIADNPPPG